MELMMAVKIEVLVVVWILALAVKSVFEPDRSTPK
jgi:hypothetical protein